MSAIISEWACISINVWQTLGDATVVKTSACSLTLDDEEKVPILIGGMSEVSVVFEVEEEDGMVVLLFLNLLVVCFCFILDNHGGKIDIK